MTARIASLQRWIPTISPKYKSPTHLRALTDVFESIARGEPRKALTVLPPRHGKTETVLHGVAWLLRQNPTLRVALCTYSQRYSELQSRRLRRMCERAGVPLDESSKALANWRTGVEDGSVWATSPGGPITGLGFDVIILDDLIKDRASAESPLEREKLADWFDSTLSTREEPGCSDVASMTAWHEAGIDAHLVKKDFELIRLPAISHEGKALWPERFPVEELYRRREAIGEYAFLGLYQGVPPSRGGAIFKDCYRYESLPTGLRVVIGLDLAYTKKTKSDYSVAVVMGVDDATGVCYVLEVVRKQVIVSDFKVTLDSLAGRYPGVRPFLWAGGQERAVVELLNQQRGIQIDCAPAVQDKFSRAQPVSAAWCAGKVLVPHSAPWLDAFVSEVVSFTGSDKRDDQIDATAAAFERARVAGILAARREARRELLQGAVDFLDREAAMTGMNGYQLAEYQRQQAHLEYLANLTRLAKAKETPGKPGSAEWLAKEAAAWEAACRGEGNGRSGHELDAYEFRELTRKR